MFSQNFKEKKPSDDFDSVIGITYFKKFYEKNNITFSLHFKFLFFAKPRRIVHPKNHQSTISRDEKCRFYRN